MQSIKAVMKSVEQIAFKTPSPAFTAQVNCACAYTAASHADAWLAEHFQKQNALIKLTIAKHDAQCALHSQLEAKCTVAISATARKYYGLKRQASNSESPPTT
ncbi:hypothetical protein [Desulfocurvibacter africanus]|uniref:hypothetical protein n=1 Tax=Desulfocurvibacter africanus TaxID=873 RepID=UPI00059C12C3|nr:hypothetical protein [Desulfocurvibacter africanus]